MKELPVRCVFSNLHVLEMRQLEVVLLKVMYGCFGRETPTPWTKNVCLLMTTRRPGEYRRGPPEDLGMLLHRCEIL